MPNYYDDVGEDSIKPGYSAKSEDINEIQAHIAAAIAQEVSDNEGNAFLLDPVEDAFKLTPATTLTDQTNQVTTNSDYKDLKDVYVRQKVRITKSSIKTFYITLKNTATSSISVNFELRAPLLEVDDSDPIATYSLTLPASTSSTVYPLQFNADHLVAGDYYLIIQRTNATGLQILYDKSGSYTDGEGNNIKGMEESADGVTYNSLDYSLWFYEEYGTTATFDIQSSIAELSGEKIQNLDTHITISAASAYGNRKDIVCFTPRGWFETVEGDVAATPELPTAKIPTNYLPIAEITILKNQSNATNMTVDQDDTLGEYRKRSLLERMRRVEKKLDYVYTQNAPQRIKYPGPIPFIDAGNSSNVAWDSNSNSYVLSNTQTQTQNWTLKDNNLIDIESTTNIDHTDLTDGIAKLLTTETYSLPVYCDISNYPNHGTWNWTDYTYADSNRTSYYIAIHTEVDEGGYLYDQVPDLRTFENVKTLHCCVFKWNSDWTNPYSGWEYIAEANSVEISDYDTTKNQFVPGQIGPQFLFPTLPWLDPGWYLFVYYPDPLDQSKPAIVHATSFRSTDWTDTYKYSTQTGVFMGRYPMRKIIAGNEKSGIVEYIKRTEEAITHHVTFKKPAYQSGGVLVSSPLVTSADISSVSIDMNLTLPSGTSYKLEVSNDGGTTFYQMTGSTLSFTNTSGCRSFVWKLTLYTTDGKTTPILSYDSDKGYALQANLVLGGGAPATDGTLVTTSFDGATISKDVLRTNIDKFSHWEWLRVFATAPTTATEETEQGTSLLINIEARNDASTYYTIKEGLRLGDLSHESVDFSLYEGTVEPDEYNYDCLIDPDVIAKTTTYLNESSMTTAQAGNVVISSDTTSTYLMNGTIANKIAIASGATTGKLAYINTYQNPNLVPINVETGTDYAGATTGWTKYNSDETITSDATYYVNGSKSLKCICPGTNANEGVYFTASNLTIGQTYAVTINAYIPNSTVLTLGTSSATTNITGTGIYKAYTTTFTATATTQNLNILTGNSPQAVTFYVDAVRVALNNTVADMSELEQLRIEFCSSVALANGDMQIALSDGTNTAKYNVPTTTANIQEEIVVNISEPASNTGVDFTRISSIALWMVTDKTCNIWIDRIEGLATSAYPFYQNFVRFRFKIHRDSAALQSPSVRKIGAVLDLT